jgi:fucose permease
MKNLSIKIALFLNYFVFAILLNSVGTVILQVQRNFDISKSEASYLEGFKDLSIAITAFFVASFLPKIGLKKAMLIGLLFVTISCFFVPLVNNFWYFKLLFLSIGVSFALIKVSVFATIGIITNSDKAHASFMNFIEAFFMAGIMIGTILISQFIDDQNPKSEKWMQIYWYLSALSLIAFVLLFFSKLDETASKIETRSFQSDFIEMLQMIIKPLIIVTVFSLFFYVMLEQSFSTWMPTFYTEILKTPSSMAIQVGGILAGASFIGRLLTGFVLMRVKWIYLLSFCLVLIAIIVIIVLPMSSARSFPSINASWTNAPISVYLLPIMGLFMAPIYPTINSTILSSLPKHMHSSVSGLIVIFSAIGGTIGSIITGHIFESFDGKTAFYFSLIPIVILVTLLWILYKMIGTGKEN